VSGIVTPHFPDGDDAPHQRAERGSPMDLAARLEILEAQVAAQADVIEALVEHAGGEMAGEGGPAELLARQLQASRERLAAKRAQDRGE
jgi:hypothetical protein